MGADGAPAARALDDEPRHTRRRRGAFHAAVPRARRGDGDRGWLRARALPGEVRCAGGPHALRERAQGPDPAHGRRLGGEPLSLPQSGAGRSRGSPALRRSRMGEPAHRRALRMAVPLRRHHGGDLMGLHAFRLRRFLESLPPAELQRVEEPVELGDVAAMHDGNAKAVWFARAGGAELAANVTASRSRLAIAFGTTPDRLLAEVLKRLGEPQPVTEVKQAPAQEVVERDPDLTALPVHLQHGYDGAPYISASMDFTRDAARDVTNVGIRRLMLRGRREAGVDLNAPSDLQAIYRAAVARKERLPIAFVVGSHPVDHVAAAMRLPGDELSLMAALRGTALPVVKCKTSDLRVPADAEYVLEGYLDERGYVEPEGPYGEVLGYYGALKTNP